MTIMIRENVVDQAFVKLEKAAETGDERAFVQTARRIKWKTRLPEDFLRALQWAFAAGALMYARQLATRGATLYPEHQKLQKHAAILAPPKIIQVAPASLPDIKANQTWLKKHGKSYRDQWVALENGNLLGASPTLKELITLVGRKEGILFTKGV